MKKLIYILLLSVSLGWVSCSSELDEYWKDPSKYVPQEPEQTVSGLLTNMQKTRFWLEDYGEWYWLLSYQTFEVPQLAALAPYSESFINANADAEYGNLDRFMADANGNTYGRFSRFYTDLRSYMSINDEIAEMERLGKPTTNAIIYQRLATVLKNVVALQTVDIFNSIPYTEAFKGTSGVFFPKYDDPMEIYKSVIDEYKTIVAELPSIYANMSDVHKKTFETQDIFFKGDINKWMQYINSQNLKACVRISGVAEDYVKPYIAEAIKNLPAEDFMMTSPQLNENRVGLSSGGIIQRGRYENYYCMTIPDVIMTRMNRGGDEYDINEDDPRLPAIAIGFTPDGTTDRVEYYGVSMNWERQRHLRITLPIIKEVDGKGNSYDVNGGRWNITNPLDKTPGVSHSNMIRPQFSMDVMVKSCMFSYYNPVTYVLSESPLRIVSQAETDLFLAEVALKNLASTGKTAGAHIKDAVKHSTDYWYMMNAAPNYAGTMTDATKAILTPTKPSTAIIDNYANKVQGEFDAAAGVEGKMEILMQQKYIHLNIAGAYEAFAELRRTRHPKLEPITCIIPAKSLINQTMMLERFTLPPSERTNNMESYSAVMEDDKWGNPVFWVPQSKVSESYFLPAAIKPSLP
ncbi:SusD/RagB family nutrient-binding outer membrane lipoprotein [Dysgonomonas reticulitermitis]